MRELEWPTPFLSEIFWCETNLVVWAIATRGIYESLAYFICYYFVRMYYFSWDKFRANDSVYFCLSFFLHFRIDCHRHEQCLYGWNWLVVPVMSIISYIRFFYSTHQRHLRQSAGHPKLAIYTTYPRILPKLGWWEERRMAKFLRFLYLLWTRLPREVQDS